MRRSKQRKNTVGGGFGSPQASPEKSTPINSRGSMDEMQNMADRLASGEFDMSKLTQNLGLIPGGPVSSDPFSQLSPISLNTSTTGKGVFDKAEFPPLSVLTTSSPTKSFQPKELIKLRRVDGKWTETKRFIPDANSKEETKTRRLGSASRWISLSDLIDTSIDTVWIYAENLLNWLEGTVPETATNPTGLVTPSTSNTITSNPTQTSPPAWINSAPVPPKTPDSPPVWIASVTIPAPTPVAVPTPTPVTIPAPTPVTIPDPTAVTIPDPTAVSTSDPTPVPDSNPVSTSNPGLISDSASVTPSNLTSGSVSIPVATPESIPTPVSTVDPTSNHTPNPVSISVVSSDPTPAPVMVPDPIPVMVPDPTPVMVPDLTPVMVPDSAPVMVPDPTPVSIPVKPSINNIPFNVFSSPQGLENTPSGEGSSVNSTDPEFDSPEEDETIVKPTVNSTSKPPPIRDTTANQVGPGPARPPRNDIVRPDGISGSGLKPLFPVGFSNSSSVNPTPLSNVVLPRPSEPQPENISSSSSHSNVVSSSNLWQPSNSAFSANINSPPTISTTTRPPTIPNLSPETNHSNNPGQPNSPINSNLSTMSTHSSTHSTSSNHSINRPFSIVSDRVEQSSYKRKKSQSWLTNLIILVVFILFWIILTWLFGEFVDVDIWLLAAGIGIFLTIFFMMIGPFISKDKSRNKRRRNKNGWLYSFFGLILILSYGIGFGRWVYLDNQSNKKEQTNVPV